MFTGLIETTGEIKSVSFENKSAQIAVRPDAADFECKIGDSVAVDGVCLTIEKINGSIIFFRAVKETLSKTTLANAEISRTVNLERAMKADGRFGGHVVLGHIDTTGRIERIINDGDSLLFFVSVDDEYSKYTAKKGSVALDGISLTVADLTQNGFFLSVIPHTFKNTTLALKKAGCLVNIECDVFAKYIERMIMKRESGERILNLLEEGGF
jgi:riboflavin synthase